MPGNPGKNERLEGSQEAREKELIMHVRGGRGEREGRGGGNPAKMERGAVIGGGTWLL